MLLYIAMTHAWAYPPQLLRHMGEYLPIKILLYLAMTHAWAYPSPPLLRHMGGYLSIIMLLFIAMTHAGCGLKLCSVTKNSDDKLYSPLSET